MPRMSDQEYDRYHQYLEEKADAEQWDAMYGDPCTCEWRELRYGRVCVRRLCAHCKEGIANAKHMRAVLAGIPRPKVFIRVDDGRL